MKLVKKPAQHKKDNWLESGFRHVWLPYTQMQTASIPLPIIDAEGCKIKLEDGRELIDGVSSWWSACHGYKHPHIINAIKEQAEKLSHIMFGGLANEPAYRLAERLVTIVPDGLTRVFFSDSGSTAVEVAMKMAIQYWSNRGIPEKSQFINFRNAYHGDTFGAMALSDPNDWIHDSFSKYNEGKQMTLHLPRNKNELEEFAESLPKIKNQVAALIIEPLVQCAGGFKFHKPEILKAISNISKQNNILLIADEIAVGFGRSGKMFACEEAGITPDILCLGKALTGGTIGLSSTIATEEIFSSFLSEDYAKALMHGPTYMGNALACAAANASLDLFESEPRLKQVAHIEIIMCNALKKCADLNIVKEVRVKGAIGVVELHETDWSKIHAARKQFIEMGVWLRPFGNVFYIMPPFVIKNDELSALTDATYEVLKQL